MNATYMDHLCCHPDQLEGNAEVIQAENPAARERPSAVEGGCGVL